MTPYEALYGRKYRTPLCWYQDGETVLVGPELIQQTTKKVKQIQERMKAYESRQKSYADKRRKPLEFATEDHVFMRVTPTKGVGRVIKLGKLSPEFVEPYQILRRIGPVAYEIAIPSQLANLHNVFHVSQLRKYIPNPSHVLEVDNVQIKDNLSFEAKPVRIEDHQSKQLKGKTINTVKVVWDDKFGDSTWELEETIRETYPYLFFGLVFVSSES
ncbi:uncharacterized protein [Phaseolus vulgaris]|uniref:uncharacterized protein n=1 Tax=Phaseolus vulgaris TaxID=3885 RepID=UPI0035CB6A2C